jgi:hypothetical protein
MRNEKQKKIKHFIIVNLNNTLLKLAVLIPKQ